MLWWVQPIMMEEQVENILSIQNQPKFQES